MTEYVVTTMAEKTGELDVHHIVSESAKEAKEYYVAQGQEVLSIHAGGVRMYEFIKARERRVRKLWIVADILNSLSALVLLAYIPIALFMGFIDTYENYVEVTLFLDLALFVAVACGILYLGALLLRYVLDQRIKPVSITASELDKASVSIREMI